MSALLLAFQLAQATVTGRVIDKVSNEPVSAALVQLSESGRQAVTDANGRYTFQNVSPGPQHLNVSSLGYFDRSVHALLPRVGTLELNVTLIGRPLPLPRVEVRIPPAVRGADDAGLQGFERSVSMATLRTHPNTAEPDALLALSGGHVLVRPESPSGIHVRGGASDQLVYLLDGIPIFSPYHTAGLFSAWNPDAIAQVQLSSMAPSVARPEALSGFVNARVRDPGSRSSMIGALSTTQARATIDGQVPRIGVGYLISMRAGFPDAFAPSDESSYLHGETSDMLAKVVTTGRLGMLSLIAYGSEDEIQTSASHDETLPNRFRNGFEWQAESFGIGYVPTSSGTH